MTGFARVGVQPVIAAIGVAGRQTYRIVADDDTSVEVACVNDLSQPDNFNVVHWDAPDATFHVWRSVGNGFVEIGQTQDRRFLDFGDG